jgi:chromatin remodeling complex protein RSC6
MPSKNKSSKSKKSKKVVPVVDPVVEPVVESVVDPVVEPVVDTPVVDEPSVDTVDEFDYTSEVTTLKDTLRDALALIKSLTVQVNTFEKRLNRDKKVVQKRLNKKPRRASSGLNGFSKPGPVSDELRKFLTLGKEDLIARTDVTKRITIYCVEHKLQNEADKRIILPNKALTKLLNVPKGEVLTYFNLQKYMKVHFPNKDGVYPTL